MKKTKLTIIFSILLAFSCLAIAVGAQLKPYAFPLIGKWQPDRDPILVDDFGFQDIQNLRKDGNKLKGVSGHTKINSTVWNSTNIYPRNGFHFRKHQPSESHVIITATDTSSANPKLFQNETAIPSAGLFATTSEILYTEDTSAGLGRFSNAPQGNVVYTNGAESLIWGGDELVVAGFENYDPYGSFSYNYYDAVSNSSTASSKLATLISADITIDTYTKLLLHCDGTDAATNFTDDGDTGHTVTAVADAQLDTAYYVFGSASGLFDGTGDYLTVPDHADWTLGTAEFTIDMWVYLSDLTQETTLIGHRTDDSNYWSLDITTTGKLRFYQDTGGATDILIETSTGVISTGTEYHVALVRDSGANFYLFVNGVLKKSKNDTDTIADKSQVLVIGAATHGGTAEYMEGWLEEIRLSNGIARWTSDFEVPTSATVSEDRTYVRVGSPRPLQGIKFYVDTANTTAGTMSIFYWDGSGWTSVSSLSDGTASGGVPLAQTGSATFTSTVGSAKSRIISGLELYWYKVEISECDDTAKLYQVTLDAPMQAMTNIWDGNLSEIASAYVYEDSAYKDYTDELTDETTIYYAVVDSLATTEALYLGSTSPQQGFDIRLRPGKENSSSAVALVYYWDGDTWTAVSGLVDGTTQSGNSLAKSGIISFDKVAAGSEFERDIQQEIPLYWYKIQWTGALDAEVEIYNITGIEAPEDIAGYRFPAMFQGRTFLFGEDDKALNKAIYSAYNTPHVFNGSDSGVLYFGDESEVVATATIYNVFQTSGLDQLLIFKKNETWRLFGDGPENWQSQQMTGNVGCIAPLSVAVAEISDIVEGLKRHVVIWQSAHGVYESDGASIQRISDDIENYWDPNNTDYIPAARMDDSVGWYNPNLQSYKLLISSGSGQTTHNVELEYSLRYKEWTKVYREDSSGAYPLQVGFPVIDTAGNVYTYGAANDGYMYRLENGDDWDGTAIDQYVWTKALMLDGEQPFFRSTIVKYFRFIYENKASTAEVTIGHYCDGTATTDGSSNQSEPAAVDTQTGRINTQDVNLGPCKTHSWKLSASTDNVTDGIGLVGLGMYYDDLKVIQE